LQSGVLYIVVGKEFLQMAEASAKSVKRYNPTLKIHVFTDQENVYSPYIDSYNTIDSPNRRSKVDYIAESPFDRTLFLDADTRVVDNIGSLFKLLDNFDIGLAHAPQRNSFLTNQLWRCKIPYAFPQLNSGVVLFTNKPDVIELLRNWKKMFHSNRFKKDQVTLRELLWGSKLRLIILPPEYNIRFNKFIKQFKEEAISPKILHLNEFRFEYNAIDKVSRSLTSKISLKTFLKKSKWIWNSLPSWKAKFGIKSKL